MAANIEENENDMAKKTPLQTVKETYGSKEELITKVASMVQPEEGESAEEHTKRLKYVSNAKLLHLVSLAERAEGFGGREGMVAKILELKKQPKDHEYKDRLVKLSTGRLVDLTEGLSRTSKT